MKPHSLPYPAVLVLALVLLLGPLAPRAGAQGKKTFVAYSMQVAQARVEAAMRTGENFRTTQPDLFYLGGITRPWAVVLDTQTGDWILVGERDPKAAVLTLDDWAVALRARFLHGEKDPGVTINPRPSEACLKAGQREGCRAATRQDVRFFGGIEDTHFGQVCYEADWLLKRISLALERLPVPGFRTVYDLAVEQARQVGRRQSFVSSRFWFYPIVSRVNVLREVVLLEALQLGVFTEVLYAEVDGKPVADVEKFAHAPGEGFARSFSEHYDAAAQERDVLETLRGLTRLAALAQGLVQVDQQPEVAFFLTGYVVAKVQTLREVEVLRTEHKEVGLQMAGGARLMALALRLQGGDVSALRALVLGSRPPGAALSWEFELEIEHGRLKAVILPSALADPRQLGHLWSQGAFLYDKKRYEAMIEVVNKILQLNPSLAEAYVARGAGYRRLGSPELAIADYTHALALNPRLTQAYRHRAAAYDNKGLHDRAIADLSTAIALNPHDATTYTDRGVVYEHKGLHDRAIAEHTKALVLDPSLVVAYINRGAAHYHKQQYDRAIADWSIAISLNPHDAPTYTHRGRVYLHKQQYDRAIADLSTAISLNPNDATAYYYRGIAYYHNDELYDRVLTDFSHALALNPNLAAAYSKRGAVYLDKQDYDRAIADFSHALTLNPNLAAVYTSRAWAWFLKKDYDQAWADIRRCRQAGGVPDPALVERLRTASGMRKSVR